MTMDRDEAIAWVGTRYRDRPLFTKAALSSISSQLGELAYPGGHIMITGLDDEKVMHYARQETWMDKYDGKHEAM